MKGMARIGRPSKMNGITCAKLDEAFMMGFSDDEASLFAGINTSTLTRFCEKNLDFRTRKEALKKHPNLLSKKNIVGEIEKGDLSLSQWWLEHRDDDFRNRNQGQMVGDIIINLLSYADSHRDTIQIQGAGVPKDLPESVG